MRGENYENNVVKSVLSSSNCLFLALKPKRFVFLHVNQHLSPVLTMFGAAGAETIWTELMSLYSCGCLFFRCLLVSTQPYLHLKC